MMSRGEISVFIGMLPAMKTTEPYSPTARAKARAKPVSQAGRSRSEEHTSELQSLAYLVCRLLLEKKKKLLQHLSQEHLKRHPAQFADPREWSPHDHPYDSLHLPLFAAPQLSELQNTRHYLVTLH